MNTRLNEIQRLWCRAAYRMHFNSRNFSTCLCVWGLYPELEAHNLHRFLHDGQLSSRRVFVMNTIPPQGIGAVSLISDGMAPTPYEESYS